VHFGCPDQETALSLLMPRSGTAHRALRQRQAVHGLQRASIPPAATCRRLAATTAGRRAEPRARRGSASSIDDSSARGRPALVGGDRVGRPRAAPGTADVGRAQVDSSSAAPTATT